MLEEKVTELLCPNTVIRIQELQKKIKASCSLLESESFILISSGKSISKEDVVEKLVNQDLKNISPLDIIQADDFCDSGIHNCEQKINELRSIISSNEKNKTVELWESQLKEFQKIKSAIDQMAVMPELQTKVIHSLASKYTLFTVNVLPKVLNIIVVNYLIDEKSLYKLYDLYRKDLKRLLKKIYTRSIDHDYSDSETGRQNIRDFFAEFEKFIAESEAEPEVTAERIGAICFGSDVLLKNTLKIFFWYCGLSKESSAMLRQLESLGAALNIKFVDTQIVSKP